MVLDLGGSVGALALIAPAEWAGREVELVAADGSRTHSEVRERRLPGGVVHAAVYPGVPAGRYAVDGTGESVTVVGGRVSEVRVGAPRGGRQ